MYLDLIVMAADKHIQIVLEEFFKRFLSRIRRDYLIAGNDQTAFHRAVEYLRPYIRSARYCLVVLDFRWSHPFQDAMQMRDELKKRLEENGWRERCEAVVIDPMLKSWLWADIQTLARVISPRKEDQDRIVKTLQNRRAGSNKPKDPKSALRGLRVAGFKPDSAFRARVAQEIPEEVVRQCRDPSFSILRSTLSSWFGLWQ